MREHTAGTATGVESGDTVHVGEETTKKGQTNFSHALEPPKVILELEELPILFFLHVILLMQADYK